MDRSPGLILDRDGVIIENREDYVRRWEEVVFLPGALEALADVRGLPLKVVIITNQSAVGRGRITLAQAEGINQKIVDHIHVHGGRIDGVYMCPHHPEETCACRKPKPGLVIQAAEDLDLDLAQSILVGDTWSDILAGAAGGVGRWILVRTGLGESQIGTPPTDRIAQGTAICADLSEAIHHLRARF